MKEFGDGFNREIDGFDAFFDDTGDETRTERDKDDVARFEVQRGRISQDRAAGAENLCGDDLKKHTSII